MKLYKEFPKPIGEYIVGRTQYDFRYKASDESERELTAFIYYPADSNEGKPTAEYAFPEVVSLWNQALVSSGITADQLFAFDLKTWCYDDLALSKKEKNYPVVFYSHGGTAYPTQGTVICSDLASLGYIAIAIGHSGSGIFRCKDGRLKHLTKEFIDTLDAFGKDPIMVKNLGNLYGGRLDEARAIEVSREVLSSPGAVEMSKYAYFQKEDASYVADCIEKMNKDEIESIFSNRLKLEIGIGVFGHSFGGASTALVCRDDKRFVCGINYDGGMPGMADINVRKPFMMLGSNLSYNMNASVLNTNSKETYFIIAENVNHFDFGDFLFSSISETARGAWDSMEFREVMTTFTKEFFDKYLLNKAVDIEGIAFKGVEVIKQA